MACLFVRAVLEAANSPCVDPANATLVNQSLRAFGPPDDRVVINCLLLDCDDNEPPLEPKVKDSPFSTGTLFGRVICSSSAGAEAGNGSELGGPLAVSRPVSVFSVEGAFRISRANRFVAICTFTNVPNRTDAFTPLAGIILAFLTSSAVASDKTSASTPSAMSSIGDVPSSAATF